MDYSVDPFINNGLKKTSDKSVDCTFRLGKETFIANKEKFDKLFNFKQVELSQGPLIDDNLSLRVTKQKSGFSMKRYIDISVKDLQGFVFGG